MITVGITTRNRPHALRRCLASLMLIESSIASIIVADDHSRPEVDAESLRPLTGRVPLDVIVSNGYIHGRNQVVAHAPTPFVLLLDDDAVLLSGAAIDSARQVLETDTSVGAVAFAQANADGSPWPDSMQPARASSPAVVPTFIGFAHLVRRESFLALGGYRERLVFYGEEKDFCLRLLDAGHRVVYLPQARVAHVPEPAGRDHSRYVRHAIRNDCLTSLFTEPLPMVLAGFPVRLWRYSRMAKGVPGGDRGGMWWIVRQVFAAVPAAWRERRPVSWTTIRRWRRLARQAESYSAPDGSLP